MSRSPVWTSFAVAWLALFTIPAVAATFTVTTTNDSGAGSFRQALLDANGAAGLDTIEFSIPGAGVHTITLTSLLPNISSPVFIDGYTQPGSGANSNAMSAGINAVLQIELTGTQVSLLFVAGSDGSTVRGLVINGSSNDKISGSVNNLTVAGNFLGTNAAGTAAASGLFGGFGVRIGGSATNATIGGPNAADRNLISGSSQGSVTLPFPSTTGHLVQGNYLGTDVTGTAALNTAGSTTTGLQNIGGANVFGNLVSGNLGGGVVLFGNNVFQGNLVGTQRDGTTALPNGNFGGIVIDGSGSTIGGSGAGQGNVIAFNVNSGIDFLLGSNNNRIVQNSIHSNTALGMTLVHSGTPFANDAGDADTVPGNHGQNYPVITSAAIAAGTATLSGSINSNASTALHIEFFANVACDASGNGEGRTFLGAADVVTDASGNASFGPLGFSVPAGQSVITSNATSPAGDTSEFSVCLTATGAAQPDLTISKVHAGSFVQGSSGNTYSVTVTNSGAGDKAAGQSVSVTDAPPSGLAVTAMSGSGWTCTTLPTCTRSDLLAAGNGYPSITVSVSVTGNAISPQINSVTVSTAQAESSSANNTATDSTVIVTAGGPVGGPISGQPIPTLAEWARIVTGLLLAILAAWHLRRRRRSHGSVQRGPVI
jgi:parallel beta-helix repeat protein